MFSAAVLDLSRRSVHNDNCYSNVECVLQCNGIIYNNIKIIYRKYRPVLSSLNIILHTRDRRARAVFGPAVFFIAPIAMHVEEKRRKNMRFLQSYDT